MKIALSYICSVICIGFVLCWVLLMRFESAWNRWGGHLSWDQPQGPFTQFWVVMPIILAIIGAVAVWLPLSTVGKTTLLGSLLILCLASLFLDELTVLGGARTFKAKISTMLKGSIPLLFPLLTWTAEFMLSKMHKSSLTQANRETTKDYAIASLILSLTFVILGPLGSIPGIICGHIALKKYKSAVTQEGRGMAKAGTIIGWVGLAYYLVPIIFYLIKFHQVYRP